MRIGVALTLSGFSFVVALAGSSFVGTRIPEAHSTIGLGSFEDVLQNGRKETMSHSISTLLTRNLYDVFGESDPAHRRAAIDEIYTEDVVFYEPNGGVYRGRDEIDRVAASVRTAHADSRYQPIGKPEELGNAGRIRWVEGRPDEAPGIAGTDFIITRDGRIAAIYLFFDKLP